MAPSKSEKMKCNLRDKKNKNLKKNKEDSESDEDEYETLSETEESDETDSSYLPQKRKSNKRKEEESEEDDSDDSEDEKFDKKDFKKTLSTLFPSKYMSKKADNEDKKKSESKKNVKSKKSKDKSKKSKKEESESEEEDDEEDEENEEDEDAEKNINIVFSIGGGGDEEWEYEYDEEELNESSDREYDTDDEKTFMKESYTEIKLPKEVVEKQNEEKENKKADKKSKKSKDKKKSKKEEESKTEDEGTDVEDEYLELQELKKQLTERLQKKPNSKILLNAINDCKDTILELIKKARSKNTKNYHKLVTSDRKKTNEIDYFKNKLSNKQQLKIMKDLKEINSHINIDKPYRLALLEAKMPAKYKAIALQKLIALKTMEPGESEYYKIKNWVDTFMKIPFGINKSLSVKMDDGIEKCHNFMDNAKQVLDDCVYGLEDAKMQIMQMIGQWISNPGAMGTAIAIKGPPGTGKTSLVKEGISKILGREFAFIALGGAGDASFLEGHSYTYEGSSWGKILQILIDSKCMNPVIYFDELDKISDTPRGEEIVGILTHLTDTSQNTQYHDKYFSEIDFDLSKCLFIFSYNDESKVNPILKDRMYRIQTKGYDAKEKTIIAQKYILPKIREQVNFTEKDVIIPDDTIQYLVSNEVFTNNEAGVRNLKRCLEIIHTKLNLFRLMKPDTKLFSKDMDIKVEFPFTVTRKDVDVFIKNDEKQNQSLLAMYV